MSLFKRNKSKNVRIVPNQDFLDGGFRFKRGEVYKVEIGLARYFERNGWLEGSDLSNPKPAVLDVDNGRLGHGGGF